MANRKWYWWSRVTLLLSVVVLVVGTTLYGSLPSVLAISCGDVLVSGSSWAKGFGVDVHSNAPYDGATSGASCTNNGNGSYVTNLNATPPQYGWGWQCVEFAQRMYNTRGWYSGVFPNVNGAVDIYGQASAMGMTPTLDGSVNPASLVPGDMIITQEATFGHVMMVDSVSGNSIYTVDQNGGDGGRTTVTVTNGHMSDGSYYQFKGVVHSPNDHLGRKVVGDWDGDGTTNPTLFRESDGTWHWRTNAGGDNTQQFGSTGDVPVPGWYSGAAVPDYATFRPSNSSWYWKPLSGGSYSQGFGSSGDIPVPGDYDGVGHTQLAVFRPSNSTWYWLSAGGTSSQQFGQAGDIPAPAVWDGGTKTEPGVFRPSAGEWLYLTPSGTATQYYGSSGDDPEPGYYSGSSKPDYGLFRPSNSTWYWFRQGDTGGNSRGFGQSGDIPMPGYYTGSTTENFGLYRPSNGTWHWYCGGDCSQSFGQSSDVPAVSTLPYPILHSLGLL